MSLIGRALQRVEVEERSSLSLLDPSDWWEILPYAAPVTAGVTVTPATVRGLPAVDKAVDYVAKQFAAVAKHVVQRSDNGLERLTRHPLQPLLEIAPNPAVTAYDFFEDSMSDLLYWGNTYAWVRFNGRGDVAELWRMPPNSTELVMDDDTGRRYYNAVFDNRTLQLAPSQVLHVKLRSYSGYVGEAPAYVQKEAFGNALAAQYFEGAYYGNKGQLGGLLMAPGKVDDPAAVLQEFNKVYQGAKKAHKTALLQKGMEYKPIDVTPHGAEMNETMRKHRVELATLLGAPPHTIGEPSKYNNREHESRDFVKNTLEPLCKKFCSAMNVKLLRGAERFRGVRVWFDTDSLLDGDVETRAEYNKKALGSLQESAWMTVNEVRKREGLNPIDGGDELLKPMQQAPADDPADEPAAEPADDEAAERLRRIQMDTAGRCFRRAEQAVKRAGPDAAACEAAWLGEAGFIANALHVTEDAALAALKAGPLEGGEELLARLGL